MARLLELARLVYRHAHDGSAVRVRHLVVRDVHVVVDVTPAASPYRCVLNLKALALAPAPKASLEDLVSYFRANY